MRRATILAAALVAIAVLWPTTPAAAHPLGNFTVNVYSGVIVQPGRVIVDYVVDMAEIPAFRERRTIDVDLDGRIDPGESSRYRETMCASIADGVALRIDGRTAPVVAADVHGLSFPEGAGGLSTLRLECRLTGEPVSELGASTTIDYVDRNFADAIGWREVTAVGDGTTLSGADVPSTSVTGRLTAYPPGERSPDFTAASVTATR